MLKVLSLIPGAHMAEGEDQVLRSPCVSGVQPQIKYKYARQGVVND